LGKRGKRALVIVAGLLVLAGATWAALASVYDIIYFKSLGPEMLPNLGRGARVLVDKRRTPARGDIVVVEAKPGHLVLRRVVALPGEHVAFIDTRPFVDGVHTTWTEVGSTLLDKRETLVEREQVGTRSYLVLDDVNRRMYSLFSRPVEGGYWLLEDNRDYLLGEDSRHQGAIPQGRIRGVVTWIIDPGDLPYVRPTPAPDAGVAK
jgi:signal peptidase I